MRRDPPIRADGLCVVCRGERKMPKQHPKGIDVGVYFSDPFCSCKCAREFFGVTFANNSTSSTPNARAMALEAA